jgi:hypothetical protein
MFFNRVVKEAPPHPPLGILNCNGSPRRIPSLKHEVEWMTHATNAKVPAVLKSKKGETKHCVCPILSAKPSSMCIIICYKGNFLTTGF